MPARRFDLITFVASLFGAGFLPFMPGTFGTVVAALLYYLMPGSWFIGEPALYFSGALILFSIASSLLSTLAEKRLGHDAPQIVIDELCGYFVAVLFLPHGLMMAIYAFVLFRVFDIAKPFPANRAQKVSKGWGVVLDDLVAGLYANIVLQIMIRLFPRFFGI
ncbi:MAG: phosphatidylglycerophosphatase A [Candidatus Cloacimonadaceae bacterium]|nr:phosphatidylglycerophosphatase A [Candidatus Cloacimonadaceae bacterium]